MSHYDRSDYDPIVLGSIVLGGIVLGGGVPGEHCAETLAGRRLHVVIVERELRLLDAPD